jgi:putative flippase GtrA
MSQSKTSFLGAFTRSQASAVVATAVDFCTLAFLVEVIQFWYVAATACGAFAGAITNFMLGRHWSFRASDGAISSQAIRYGMVSVSSLFLNSAGVYLFTEFFGFKYMVSKIITATLVGVFFNFPLHRSFVFSSPGVKRVS